MALQTKDYSVTAKSSSGGITYTYILRVTENSTNVEKNTSNITVQAILKQTYSGTAFHTWYTGVSCTLNGKQIFSDYKQRSLSGTAEKVYYTWTGDVAHNADGSLSLKVGGKFWQSEYASYSPPAMTITESSSNAMVLTTIPRASTIAASDADIGSTAPVFVNRNSSAFTHTIAYKFGNLSGYIGTDGKPTSTAVKLSAESIGFKIPTSFYGQIPNDKYDICTLTCQTYSGSTKIGDAQTCTFKARTVKEDCIPVVEGTAADINDATLKLTENNQIVVRYMSRIQCTMNVDLKNQVGSIKERKIGIAPQGVVVSENTRIIEQPESASIVFEATDSREYSGKDTVTLGFVPYVMLTNNAVVTRTDPTSGNAVLTFKGQCFKGSFGAVENSIRAEYWFDDEPDRKYEVIPQINDNHRYEMSVDLIGMDYTRSYKITAVVEDRLNSIPIPITLKKGIPVFDWGERDFAFHVPVSAPSFVGVINGLYMDTVRVWDAEKSFILQSKYTAFDDVGGNRQTILIFGTANTVPVLGVLTIRSNGVCIWYGSEGVSGAKYGSTGEIQVTLPSGSYDMFGLLSADYFKI